MACNHLVDRSAGARCSHPAHALLHGEGRGAPRPGARAADRSFGAFSVRRGESDRDAVRTMRQIVRDGHALGLFAEGTRQRRASGAGSAGCCDGRDQRNVPVICAAIRGSFEWRLGNFSPVSLAWGTPLSFDGLPRGGKGYKEASVEIEREIRKLWDCSAACTSSSTARRHPADMTTSRTTSQSSTPSRSPETVAIVGFRTSASRR